MKLKVNKRWWQFWLPRYLEVEALKGFEATFKRGELVSTRTVDPLAEAVALAEPAAIEADEAEPWYGGDTVEAEDSGVVTAEPPIVYASRGNAKMAERQKINDQM